jgi:ApaG protein
LLSRRWLTTDANDKVQEVEGDGVVGEQPRLRPGEGFEYTSGAVLETDLGTMEGSYTMVADDGTRFEVPIPAFTLTVPRTLH